jgi:hypothetical protein
MPSAKTERMAMKSDTMRNRLLLAAGSRKRKQPKNPDAKKIDACSRNAGGALVPTVAAVAIVMVTLPGVEADTVTVAGLKEQVAPVGRPLQAKETSPVKPFKAVTASGALTEELTLVERVVLPPVG